MKKILAVLLTLAMLLMVVPAVFAEPAAQSEVITVQSGNQRVTETGAIEFYYTPSTDGILTLNITANPEFMFWVYNAATDESLSLPESGATGEYTYNLEAGVKYRVYIIGYYNWGQAAAKINYTATFVEAEAEVVVVDIDKAETDLVLGENTVDLLPNTIVTLYDFIPAEPGIYTITVGEGVTMATYSFTYFLIAEAENGVVTHTATAAEQTILIGLSAENPTVQVTIEKTGDYTPPAQIEYVEYEATDKPLKNFEEPADLVNLDITKVQQLVLGADGYYHLVTADGPIVYANLNTEQFTLAILYDAGAPITMRGVYVDEQGVEHPYNFMTMITDLYYEYSREYDYHPLNRDLMIFLKAYGTSQGWYNPSTSAFESIISGEFLEESAWLAGCYSTVDYVEPITSWTEVKVTSGGITEVPESLKAVGMETVDDVKAALEQALTDLEAGAEGKNVAYYDVNLMFTNDVGETWTNAELSQYPEDGKITVTIPYPAGTNKNYTFTVVHMFTSDAFGKTAGDVEVPKVTNTKAGIQFELTGTSPIIVGWDAPANPETGDNTQVFMLFALMLISAGGILLLTNKKKFLG